MPGARSGPGKSAFQLWLEAGHVGTVDDFLASLRGSQGPGGNVELGSVEATAAVTITTATLDVPACTISVTAGTRPFLLEAEAFAQIGLGSGSAGGDAMIGFFIYDQTAGAVVATAYWKAKVPAASNVQSMIRASRRMSLAQGTTKTYGIRVRSLAQPANTGQSLQAGAGNVDGTAPPIILRATEL